MNGVDAPAERADGRRLLITIDGPAGAGKTTVSQMLARELDYRYLDTGALYRAVAYMAREAGISPQDDQRLQDLLGTMRLRLDGERLVVGTADITERIRSPEIAMLASAVSARAVVRQGLLAIQRQIGRDGGLVAEGRDMGTVVFPEADFKFFLDASMAQRAQRRLVQYGPSAGQTLEQIEAAIRRRDENDSSRAISPLRPAEDAVRIDSSRITAAQVVDRMMRHILGPCKRPPPALA